MFNSKNLSSSCKAFFFLLTLQLLYKVRLCFGGEYGKQDATGRDALDDNGHMSYLSWPRLHFNGKFRSDVSTLDNLYSNYDINSFAANQFVPNPGNWNPMGTGGWSIDARVTQVCFSNTSCYPHTGVRVTDDGNQTSAKMVDLDTQAQSFAEIWGWRIRVGDWFSGDFTAFPFQQIWSKMPAASGDLSFGAVYTSVLTNISWINKDNAFVKEIQDQKAERLSIHLNIDSFSKDRTSPNYTWGRVTGTIGISGSNAPPSFVGHGRMLRTKDKRVQNAPFIVDYNHDSVIVDLGNSLPIALTGSMNNTMLDTLAVALDLSDNPKFDCSDKVTWLGIVPNKVLPDWYEISAGIYVFPTTGSLSDKQRVQIKNHPLVIIEVYGSLPVQKCKKVVLAEHEKGLYVHPFSQWTLRTEAYNNATFKFVVTQFGEALKDTEIVFEECLDAFYTEGAPQVGIPPLPVPVPIKTDNNGIATLTIQTTDPKNSRGYIDGQLYGFCYSVASCPPAGLIGIDNLIAIKVYNQYNEEQHPTWLENIFPIFKQYANLYPVMANSFMDLGNYYDVKKHKFAITEHIKLDISHPNHMPVTRDLSEGKRRVLLKWLESDDLPIGSWTPSYTPSQLKKDLQTALQIEHAIIPPYLTAMATVKEIYNLEVQAIFKNIVLQEMLHMATVANILNAIGEEPKLYFNAFIPHYPSRLPGGVQPFLTVPIEKCSLKLIRKIFMKIEEPESMNTSMTEHSVYDDEYSSDAHGGFGQQRFGQRTQAPCPSPHYSCITFNETYGLGPPRKTFSHKDTCTKHDKATGSKTTVPSYGHPNNTIGGFYKHIQEALNHLGNTIFTGDESKQITWENLGKQHGLGKLIKVTDSKSALRAIAEITKEGEGSSRCNPFYFYNGTQDLSHYNLFKCITEKHEMQVYLKDDFPEDVQEQNSSVYFIPIGDDKCPKHHFDFQGPEIPFDEDGIWPMIKDPKMSMYKPGSRAHFHAMLFNKAYTRLLRSLEKAFNGNPNQIIDAIGMMYSVELHLKNLIRTPIDDNGNPEIGPNAGPTFEFTPE